MPKEHAKRTRARAQRKTTITPLPWLWCLSGFIMGSVLTGVLVLKFQPHPTGRLSNDALQPHNIVSNSPPNTAIKPQFDFYSILPEMEIVIPTERNLPTQAPSVAQLEPMPEPNPLTHPTAQYFLQLASFKVYQEAEEHKARLALAGVEVNIETVSLHGETWYRLRQGPFSHLQQAEAHRQQLQNHRIASLLVKLKK